MRGACAKIKGRCFLTCIDKELVVLVPIYIRQDLRVENVIMPRINVRSEPAPMMD